MPELIPAEPGTPEWHAARRQGVTATDIVTILGLSSWDSVYSLFWRKLGQVPDEPDRDRWSLGRYLEPYVRGRLADELDTYINRGHLYRHPDRTWQMATPDGVLYDDGDQGSTAITSVAECKSWADADRRSWGGGYARYAGRIDDGGVHLDPEPEQPPAGNQIPPQVRAQILWQMDVMGVGTGHVGVVFLPSGEFRSYVIGHDPSVPLGYDITHTDPVCDLCGDILMMRVAGAEFMARLRLELPPPDPDSSAATLAAVRARFAPQPAKEAEVDRLIWSDFVHGCSAIENGERWKREAEIKLREQAEEAQVLCVDGQPVARRVISDAQVKAHVRHQDYIRRIMQQGDDTDG